VLGISLPIIRIIIALLLIYGGIQLIKGLNPLTDQKAVFFGKEYIKTLHQEYKIVFGQGIVDLSDAKLEDEEARIIKVYTLFGNTIIKLNPEIPTQINASSIFSSVTFPDKTMISMGTYTYSSTKDQKPRIIIEATAIFSAVEVK
jgi:hypothetical protein